MPEQPLRLKFDGTVNLPMLGSAMALVVAGTLWVSSVNSKLDNVAQLVTQQNKTDGRLTAIENSQKSMNDKLSAMDNRGGRIATELGVQP